MGAITHPRRAPHGYRDGAAPVQPIRVRAARSARWRVTIDIAVPVRQPAPGAGQASRAPRCAPRRGGPCRLGPGFLRVSVRSRHAAGASRDSGVVGREVQPRPPSRHRLSRPDACCRAADRWHRAPRIEQRARCREDLATLVGGRARVMAPWPLPRRRPPSWGQFEAGCRATWKTGPAGSSSGCRLTSPLAEACASTPAPGCVEPGASDAAIGRLAEFCGFGPQISESGGN